MRSIRFLLCIFLSGLLLACGGSSNGSSGGSSSSSSGGSSSGGSSSSSGGENGNGPDPGPTDTVAFIVVDQFGYLPDAQKVAVIRDPQTGFDSDQSFAPGASYQLVDQDSGEAVHSGSPEAWNNGATAERSGDRVWYFDFSAVTEPGRYAVLDEENNVSSPVFRIADDVYREVLVQAVRTFYYQRAGFAKAEPYADPGWVDGASHLGSGQDPQARLHNATGDAGTERDLQGGWYDAGDFNKYTNWHADYLIALLHAYQENPTVWTDDFNLPESDNGVPDLLDEVKWGMDWLIRMQEDNGSVLSVMDLDHASPPSAASGPSRYGPASTSASRTAAAVFALGSKIFGSLDMPQLDEYANELQTRAVNAWNWAEDNPNVTFSNSGLVAAGEQEVNDYGRLIKRLQAAIYLYELTGENSYRDLVENTYDRSGEDLGVHMMQWTFVYVFEAEIQHALLYFASLPGVTPAVATHIRNTYQSAMNGEDHWPAIDSARDAYRAHLQVYTWGSNRSKAQHGNIFYDQYTFAAGSPGKSATRNAALRYIHYLHGVNPLGKAYLSNMGDYGAHNSVDQFYHAWFSNGSPHWDSVSESSYGPAPGFLVGGPNPDYNWDASCEGGGNAQCGASPPSPPHNQPDQKSYRDFNDSWPLNSWSVTENHNAYQVHYIRLLSKFVD